MNKTKLIVVLWGTYVFIEHFNYILHLLLKVSEKILKILIITKCDRISK